MDVADRVHRESFSFSDESLIFRATNLVIFRPKENGCALKCPFVNDRKKSGAPSNVIGLI